MKKICTLGVFVLCLLSATIVSAGNRYWVGPSNGNWSTATNWSPAGVPGAGDDLIFNTNTLVNMDLASVTVNSILVTVNSTARLYTAFPGGTVITVNSSSAGTPGL